MNIFDEIKKKLSHEFIDIIEWLDNSNNNPQRLEIWI